MTHTPWVNYALIAVNVAVFLLTYHQVAAADHLSAMGYPEQVVAEKYPVLGFYLYSPQSFMFHSYQFFTSQFLHAGWAHLIFNMLFLYVFGNSLEDRLGSVAYLAFYLSGGVIAGLGHVLSSPAPVLGASGAISAVTGAYLALFPLSSVTIVYWIFFIGFFEVHSIWLILFSFCHDLFYALVGGGHVAYLAHISGNVFGFAVGMGLLWTRLLEREPYDFLAMVDRWNRRRQFRAATRHGAAPWLSQAGQALSRSGAPVDDEQHRREAALRHAIAEHLADHRPTEALDDFEKLGAAAPQAVLSRQAQLDLANYAMSSQRYELAAHAYEGFLRVFETDEYRTQVQMILGLIYARYLHRPQRAAELLRSALEKLDQPDQIQLARQTLAQLETQ